MPGNQTTAASVSDQQLAFDYVTGVMRGNERKRFAQRLQREAALQAHVSYWEEELMRLSDKEQVLRPDEQTWDKISALVNRTQVQSHHFWSRWFWQSVSAATCILFATFVWLTYDNISPQQPNADYVAVLTDPAGAPQLTVLTATGGEQMWLKWETVEMPEDKNLQLWAVSKSDGQIRPLGVFDRTDIQQLPLTVPQWRLIKDSSHLLLTEEDVGGSPLDEPSEIVVAKGVCVLLAQVDKAI
ncbi:MAG TPA: anti-sigma factor [Cellvibrio sp.]|nr:anti-sigma factor [Cellvibrio sp.]